MQLKTIRTALLFAILGFTRILYAGEPELFVVHMHKWYLHKNFDDAQHNPAVKANRALKDYFCDNDLQSFHIVDRTNNFFSGYVPIRKCRTKNLRSIDGTVDHARKYRRKHKSDEVVVTGLYFTQCHRRAVASMTRTFLANKEQNTLTVHIPMNAVLFEWNIPRDIFKMPNYTPQTPITWTEETTLMLINQYFLTEKYLFRDKKTVNFNYSISIDGVAVDSLKSSTGKSKQIVFQFWTDEQKLISHLKTN